MAFHQQEFNKAPALGRFNRQRSVLVKLRQSIANPTRRSGADEELIGDWIRRVHAEEALISNQIHKHLRTLLRRAKGDNRES
jgi:hypothetical protein